MNARKGDERLQNMARAIGQSLREAPVAETGSYEYTASLKSPERHELKGLWRIVSHEVGGEPYAEVYARNRFPDERPASLDYVSTYEFQSHHCIKRVFVSAEIAKGVYEYRLTVVLSWRIRERRLTVQPLIGYQYISMDGKPAVIQELPPDPAPIGISVEFDGDILVFTDGQDVKRLERVTE